MTWIADWGRARSHPSGALHHLKARSQSLEEDCCDRTKTADNITRALPSSHTSHYRSQPKLLTTAQLLFSAYLLVSSGNSIVSPQNRHHKEGFSMPKTCNKPVRPNPFTAYRDPKTGQWMVLKTSSQGS